MILLLPAFFAPSQSSIVASHLARISPVDGGLLEGFPRDASPAPFRSEGLVLVSFFKGFSKSNTVATVMMVTVGRLSHPHQCTVPGIP